MASLYADRVIADGAVAYWRLGETSGTTANSLVGSYPGTISGGVTLGVAGALADGNPAMTFNGTTGKIVSTAAVNVVPPFSWELWFRTTDIISATHAICGLSYPSPAGGDALGLQIVNQTDFQFFAVYASGTPNTGVEFTPTPVLNNGQWHHIVVVYSSGTSVLGYLDGQAVPPFGTLRIPLVGSTTKLFEIGTSGIFGSWFPGSLDDIAIYNVALTPAQIAAHYGLAAAAAIPDVPPALPGYKAPANRWAALTPSDVLDTPFAQLWVGGAGSLDAVDQGGRVVTFAGIQAGTRLPIAGRRVNATNTTATNLLALARQ